jgi:predicted ATPase/class 3 adenylate cyclase
MNFYSVVDQAIALLRQRGRVTYRALKRQFDLDDEALADLTEELIYGQRLAADEDGRVLVWTGDMPMVTEPHASLSPSGQPSTTHEDPPAQAATPPVSPMSDAERRQLTVMFCDLVDSTALSGQLDPEDLRDIVRAYQKVCSEVITRFDGHIAQLLGDGLLVYFGYPHAHEDDAQRAVRTGLGILAAMEEDLHSRLRREKGITLALRLGIHTGLVVVGAMGGHGRQEQLALGETPNIAARIEGLAQPNTVAISEVTYHLVQGYFDCLDLGAQTLRGVAQPLKVYRVLGASGIHSRLDIASARGLTPLVGREQEVGLLLERWAQVKDGQGHVVLLTGDAGIGKSRLVQILKEHIVNDPHMRWECRSSEYSQNTTLFPLVDLFQWLWRFEAHETPNTKLEKLEHALSQYRLPVEESVPLFASLLALSLPEDRYPFLHLSPQRQRQKTLETIVAILLELAEHQPMFFIIEDLHWSDPSTLELLNLVIDQTPTASLLVLLTCRPHFQPAWHHRSYLTEITVNRLSHAQVEQIVHRMTDGKTFPKEVLAQIVEKTDGVPLFVEEITKAILESGQLQALDGHYELVGSLSTLTIPATLHDSLMARLDHLVTAKAVAQYAAVIGRGFAYDLFQAVSQLDEATLQRELRRLVETELVYQRGVPPQAHYVFKHALIRDAAYESLLKSTRQRYHQRIAQVLEAQFPETVETQPELVAQHYTEAGLHEQAMVYWQRAGQQASARSAYREAIAHFTTGLATLQAFPQTPARLERELAFQMLLGPAIIALKGYGSQEVLQVYAHAQELCQQMGDPPQAFPVLYNLARLHFNRAEHQQARALGTRLLHIAHDQDAADLLVAAHTILGATCNAQGELPAALTHHKQADAHYDRQQHHALVARFATDNGVVNRIIATWSLCPAGYLDQARSVSKATVAYAEELAHPLTLAFAYAAGTFAPLYCKERDTVRTWAEAAMSLAVEHGFTQWRGWGILLKGWVQAEHGQVEEGLVQMRQGLVTWQSAGAQSWMPNGLRLIAEVCGNKGRLEEGLQVVAEALERINRTGEHLWEAELYRLKGEILWQQHRANTPPVEACFQEALAVARHQQAKSWELRAAMSLSRLWQQQAKRAAARELLAPIYGWFTEGFDTADLQEAKVLLEELEG